MTDAVGWRSLGFLALHALLMTPIGYVVLVGVAVSARVGRFAGGVVGDR